MTVTNLHNEPDVFADLAASVIAEVRKATRQLDIDDIRSILNEVGLRRARKALADAPGRLEERQQDYRVAQSALAVATEAHDQAVLDAEWELDGRFVVESNKTWLVTPCDHCKGRGFVSSNMVDGEACPECNPKGLLEGYGVIRKAMTAEERKAWKASEARKMPAVAEAAANLRRAEETVCSARDAVTIADKRMSACKADLEASIAELNALSLALAAKGA